MSRDDDCTICAGTTEGALTTLECGHTFHVHCALQWFRYHNTSCPNCRSEACQQAWSRRTPRQRVSSLRRRRDLPVPLRRLIARLDRSREVSRRLLAERRAFKKDNAAVLREERRLWTRICASRVRERELEVRIDGEGTQTSYLSFHGEWGDEGDEDDTDLLV